MITTVVDSKPKLGNYKPVISGVICLVMFIITLNMTCDVSRQ